jgi:hypothetical protein
MRRREFIAALGGITASPAALAQRVSKQVRLAFVRSGIPAAKLTETAGPFWVRRFFEELRRLGYVEGENLIVQRYSAEGHQGRFAALAGRDRQARLDRDELQRARPCFPGRDTDSSAHWRRSMGIPTRSWSALKG